MTLFIIILLSLLSAYAFLKMIALALNTSVKDIFDSKDKLYILYQFFMTFVLFLAIFILYSAINNTFLHFKY